MKCEEIGPGVESRLMKTLGIYKEKADDYDSLSQVLVSERTKIEELTIIRESNNSELIRLEQDLQSKH